MLKLYYRPMSCSLAARMALMVAGLEAEYLPVDFRSQSSLKDGVSFGEVNAKRRVPVLVLPGGELLTEGAAVLQYIADQAPLSGLAPAAGSLDRYRLQEWLNFVGTEIHKAYLFPYFQPDTDEATKAVLRKAAAEPFAFAAARIEADFLLGNKFTVADAYFLWAALLARYAGVNMEDQITDYINHSMALPFVAQAVAIERAELQSLSAKVQGE